MLMLIFECTPQLHNLLTLMSFSIFIVEDDPWYGELLKHHLSLNPDFEVTLFTTAGDCLKNLHHHPHVICTDFGLPDMTGAELLGKIKLANNAIPVVVISGQDQIGVAVNLLRAGASDYIVKDENARELLWNAVLKIKENSALRQEVQDLKVQLEQKFSFQNTIIGQSPAIKQTFYLIEKAVKTNVNVLITGETGTGKEVVAKAIHFNSERKKAPLVAVNMAAIPRELIESELFGHEKGAFTGADRQKIGKFEEANGGTLFLDEIAELDFTLQSKILRVLQERELVKVGGTDKVKLDFRLISATHKNLMDEVKKGNFREDLYYRIIGLPIELPPLRQRDNDILMLAKHFAREFATENKTKAFVFTSEAQRKLMNYSFPGNVRELKSIIDLACVMCENNTIEAPDVVFNPIHGEADHLGAEKTMDEYYVDIIQHFLQKYQNNVVLVANKLGIGKSTVYKLIQENQLITKN